MKVCFYTDLAISGMTGGIGRVTDVLANHFRQQFGWQVFSIYAFEPKTDCVRTEVDGAVQLRLHDRLGLRRLAKNYALAAEYIGHQQIDLVIVQTSMDVVARLRRALAEVGLQRVRVVSVLHYTPGTDEFPIDTAELRKKISNGKCSAKDLAKGVVAPLFNNIEHRATVRGYQQAYEHGDAVILLSESYRKMYQDFAQLAETSRIRVIPNCVPFEHVMTDEEMHAKQQTVLTVGRMTDFPKRISSILRIWQIVERDPISQGWDLQIVGDGPDLPHFKQLATSLGLRRCTFTGRQNPFDYYLNASLFVMTSIFEGFPMTLVEAQQMGCVPVAFDSFASLREVITHDVNGRIIANDDHEAFAQSLLELMHNEALRDKMARQAEVSCKAYSQAGICAQWRELCESLLEENK